MLKIEFPVKFVGKLVENLCIYTPSYWLVISSLVYL